LSSPKDAAPVHSNLLLTLHYLPEVEPEQMLREHVEWNEKYAKPLAAEIRAHPNDRAPERRLRIGYISPDFAAHSVADFLEPLLEHHDHSRFEIFCYSDVPRPDVYTHRLRKYADVWNDIANAKDPQVIEAIRAQQIDILVDL